MKAVINVYPLNSLLGIQNEHYKQKQSVWLIMWLQIIWRVGTYLHSSSATHKIITNLSKVIIFSFAIRNLFCLIFFAFSSQEDTWISITSLRDAKNKAKIGKVKELFQSIYLLLEFGGKKWILTGERRLVKEREQLIGLKTCTWPTMTLSEKLETSFHFHPFRWHWSDRALNS